MSGHKSKPPREIFLTSSSLSFSSLSSSTSSRDDAIELHTNAARPSSEEQKGRLSNVSELSCDVTHVSMQPPAPSPPLKLRPAQLKDKGYDPERIPASVFANSTVDLNWSEISNDSLFSIPMDGCRMANFRQSNIKPEDLLMSGEFLAYSPLLSVKIEDREEDENIYEVDEELQSGETEVTIPETKIHQKKFPFSAPDIVCSTKLSKSYSMKHYIFGHAPPSTKLQPFTLPFVEKKSKKRKKTIKSKNKKKDKKNKCCILSWLSSKSSKCECDLCCFKWRKCCCYCSTPKALVSSS